MLHGYKIETAWHNMTADRKAAPVRFVKCQNYIRLICNRYVAWVHSSQVVMIEQSLVLRVES